MKTITYIILFISSHSYSQTVLSTRLATFYNSESKVSATGPGISFQTTSKGKISTGVNFDYHFGPNKSALYSIEPRVDFYTDTVFNGFHIGTNCGILVEEVANSKFLTLGYKLGGLIGVSIPAGESILFDISCGIGYSKPLESGYNSVLYFNPSFTLGTRF
jgi:hypothetical protein